MQRVRAAGPRRLIVGVGNVDEAATSYARLGLRILEQTGQRAVVELPCGIRLVLTGARA
jgi:hypothetical protein